MNRCGTWVSWCFLALCFAGAASCQGYSEAPMMQMPSVPLSSESGERWPPPAIPLLGSSVPSYPSSATDSPDTPPCGGRPMELEKSNAIFWTIGGVVGSFVAMLLAFLFFVESKKENEKWEKLKSLRWASRQSLR